MRERYRFLKVKFQKEIILSDFKFEHHSIWKVQWTKKSHFFFYAKIDAPSDRASYIKCGMFGNSILCLKRYQLGEYQKSFLVNLKDCKANKIFPYLRWKFCYKYVRVTIRCHFWQRFRISNIFILMYAGLFFSATPVWFSAALPMGDAFTLVVNQYEYIRGY